jgi:hypothetical protein
MNDITENKNHVENIDLYKDESMITMSLFKANFLYNKIKCCEKLSEEEIDELVFILKSLNNAMAKYKSIKIISETTYSCEPFQWKISHSILVVLTSILTSLIYKIF